MTSWAPIRYRGFHDVPRIFLVDYGDKVFLFSCSFSEELDEYPDAYKVYLMPRVSEKDLEVNWEELFLKATQYLGEVPVREVQFDPSRRREINTAVIDNLVCVSGTRPA